MQPPSRIGASSGSRPPEGFFTESPGEILSDLIPHLEEGHQTDVSTYIQHDSPGSSSSCASLSWAPSCFLSWTERQELNPVNSPLRHAQALGSSSPRWSASRRSRFHDRAHCLVEVVEWCLRQATR